MDELDAADEEIIKSIAFYTSKDFVRRIDDEEDEDLDGALSMLPSTGVSDHSMKRKGLVESSLTPDVLTEASIVDGIKGAGVPPSHKPKFILKPRSSSTGPLKKQCNEVDKDSCLTSDLQKNDKGEIENPQSQNGEKENGQAKVVGSIGALQSLLQNYESDESV